MRDFFKPSGRKAGIGVLLMAVALLLEWVRAQIFRAGVLEPGLLNDTFDDFCGIEFGDQSIRLTAHDLGISYPFAIGVLSLISACLILVPQRTTDVMQMFHQFFFPQVRRRGQPPKKQNITERGKTKVSGTVSGDSKRPPALARHLCFLLLESFDASVQKLFRNSPHQHVTVRGRCGDDSLLSGDCDAGSACPQP